MSITAKLWKIDLERDVELEYVSYSIFCIAVLLFEKRKNSFMLASHYILFFSLGGLDRGHFVRYRARSARLFALSTLRYPDNHVSYENHKEPP